MLATLLVLLLLGGSSGAQELIDELKFMEKSIKHEISDEMRREGAIEVIGEMIDETKAYAKYHAKSVKEIAKVSRDYDADSGYLNSAINKADDRTRSFQKRILRQLTSLKATLTREEWESISPWAEN